MDIERKDACMKIKLPVFKDEDAKDAVTVAELEVGFKGVLMCRVQGSHPPTLCNKILARLSLESWYRALVLDITLDDVLTILDEHYNNMKALDALNQELFQLWMAG